MRDPAACLTIQTIVDQIRRATGATTAWLLAGTHDGLTVVAGSGPVGPPVGTAVDVTGSRAYALSSGQAVALAPQPGDPASAGLGGADGVPVSVLLVPVLPAPVNPATRSPVGAVALLEAAGKEGARPFTLDDISRVGLLAPIAAAALTEWLDPAIRAPSPAGPSRPPSPASLTATLEQVAGHDPAAYTALAVLIRAVLGPP